MDRCKENGIIVMRMDAVTTNSIYLKFDYGVLHSLRISDHKGKVKYKYKYNLTRGSETKIIMDNGFVRAYASMRNIELLFNKVLQDRSTIIRMYGEDKYLKWVEESFRKNSASKGFWSKAKIVQKDFKIN